MNRQQKDRLYEIIKGVGEKYHYDHGILSEINVEEIETRSSYNENC